MPDLGPLAGGAMLVAGAALVVIGLVAAVPGVVRVRRRALVLRVHLVEAQRDVVVALALLRRHRAETEAILAPWRRLHRWARHPLVVATFEWYRRRRRARR